MPDKNTHLGQLSHNLSFCSQLLTAKPPTHPDWAVTALFYATLHGVDAVLDHHRAEHPKSHKQRKEILDDQETSPIPSRLTADYYQLEVISRSCRYDCLHFKKQKFTPSLLNALRLADRVLQFVADDLAVAPTRPKVLKSYQVQGNKYTIIDFI